MRELKLPHEKPKNWKEVAENYAAVKKHYTKLGRDACIESGKWAIKEGFDKKVKQFYQLLEEMLRVFGEEIFPREEIVNPFRFRVRLAMCHIEQALPYLNDAIKLCEEAKE